MTQRQARQILQPWGLNASQVAGLLGVSTNTVYRWFHACENNMADADREVNDSFWISLLSKIKVENHAEGLKSSFVREGRLGAYRYIIDVYDKSLLTSGA